MKNLCSVSPNLTQTVFSVVLSAVVLLIVSCAGQPEDVREKSPIIGQIDQLNEMSKKYWNVTPEKSVEYGQQALKLAKDISARQYEAVSLRYIGVGYMNLGDYAKALNYFFDSLRICKELNYSKGISAAFNNIAVVYDKMGLKAKSLTYYIDSMKIDEISGDAEGVAISLNNIGLVHMDMGQYEDALKYINDSLKVSTENNFKDITAMALGNIGDVYNKMGNPDMALKYTRDGLNISREIGEKKGIASKLMTIGAIYRIKEDFPQALEAFSESLKIAEESKLSDIMIENNKSISEIYAATGDYQMALKYHNNYSTIKDTVVNEEIAKRIENIETKYEIEKREKENQILELELNRLKLFKNSLIAGVGLILIILYVLFTLYRIKKKAHSNIITLSRIGQQITSSLDMDRILNTFYENLGALMPVDCFGVGIYRENTGEIEQKRIYRKKERTADRTDETSFLQQLALLSVNARQDIVINDFEKDCPAVISVASDELCKQILSSVIFLPLIANDRVLGILSVQHYQKNAYSNIHYDILKTLSSYLSIALDNSNAYLQIDIQKKQIEKNLEIIKIEKDRSEKLLLNILPAKVAEELKLNDKTAPELFNEVTVFFSDLVGFTEMSSSIDPTALIGELNDLYTHFDNIMEENHCERIKTVGDAYLAVCGLPIPNANHAVNITQSAIEIIRYLKQRNNDHQIIWQLRIGIHTGKVIAGVVGIKKYIYDVFGDTINTACRMESHSQPMKINVSETTRVLLKDKYRFIRRPPQEIKGKGKMNMFFLDI